MTWNKVSKGSSNYSEISKGTSNPSEVKADRPEIGWFKGGWFTNAWLADRQWDKVEKKESNWIKVEKE